MTRDWCSRRPLFVYEKIDERIFLRAFMMARDWCSRRPLYITSCLFFVLGRSATTPSFLPPFAQARLMLMISLQPIAPDTSWESPLRENRETDIFYVYDRRLINFFSLLTPLPRLRSFSQKGKSSPNTGEALKGKWTFRDLRDFRGFPKDQGRWNFREG